MPRNIIIFMVNYYITTTYHSVGMYYVIENKYYVIIRQKNITSYCVTNISVDIPRHTSMSAADNQIRSPLKIKIKPNPNDSGISVMPLESNRSSITVPPIETKSSLVIR